MQCTRMLSISLKIQSKAKCVCVCVRERERGGRRLKTCQGSFQIVKRPLHGRRGIHLNNTVPPLPNHFLAMAILQNILNTKAWMVQSSIQWLYSCVKLLLESTFVESQPIPFTITRTRPSTVQKFTCSNNSNNTKKIVSRRKWRVDHPP